jgi:hypothetical protein
MGGIGWRIVFSGELQGKNIKIYPKKISKTKKAVSVTEVVE